QHWPTPEEEEKIIDPERREYLPEAALELLAILERFISERPLTTRPNRGDFPWKWGRRPQPLRELYLDEFFEQCFGMYAAARRQGLDRASKRDISYCTTWLRESGWRRVQKRLSDGQRVRVWRAPDGNSDPNSGTPNSDSLGVPKTEKASQDPAADSGMAVNVTGMAPNVANVEGQIPSKAHPRKPLGCAKN